LSNINIDTSENLKYEMFNNEPKPQDQVITPPVQPEEPEELSPHHDKEPKLFVDVNVANFGLKRIVVYEGDSVDSLVADFVKRCPIDEPMVEKLKELLKKQMDGVLERIDEDDDNPDEDDDGYRRKTPSKSEGLVDDGTPVRNLINDASDEKSNKDSKQAGDDPQAAYNDINTGDQPEEKVEEVKPPN
jgi:hypothetical protein